MSQTLQEETEAVEKTLFSYEIHEQRPAATIHRLILNLICLNAPILYIIYIHHGDKNLASIWATYTSKVGIKYTSSLDMIVTYSWQLKAFSKQYWSTWSQVMIDLFEEE